MGVNRVDSMLTGGKEEEGRRGWRTGSRGRQALAITSTGKVSSFSIHKSMESSLGRKANFCLALL